MRKISRFLGIKNQINYYKLRLHLLRTNKTPVFIPTRDNPTYLSQFLNQMSRFENLDPIVLDNGSTYHKMQVLLKKIKRENKAKVFKLGQNFGPRHIVFNDDLYRILPRIFILSDPDLELSPNVDDDVIKKLIKLTDSNNLQKIGFCLEISKKYEFKNLEAEIDGKKYSIRDWEKQFWETKYDLKGVDIAFLAPIDTTFAVYNKSFFKVQNFFEAIRVSKINSLKVSMKHLPWHADFTIENDELDYYLKSKDPDKGTWLPRQ